MGFSTHIVKGGGIGCWVILEEVAGDGCVFDDIRGCIHTISIDHADEDCCQRCDDEKMQWIGHF